MVTQDDIEAIARAICQGSHEDPDMMICNGEPFRVRHGFAVTEAAPNWTKYTHMAWQAVNAAQARGLISKLPVSA